MDPKEQKYVYVITWDTNNGSWWEPGYETPLGVYSSRAAAVAGLGKLWIPRMGYVDEAIAEDDESIADDRNRPFTDEEDSEGVLLLYRGDSSDWVEVHLRKFPLKD